MKKCVYLIGALLLTAQLFSQTNVESKNQKEMKLNAGIITSKIKETKEFYQIETALVHSADVFGHNEAM